MAAYAGRRFSFAPVGASAIVLFISLASVSQLLAQTSSTIWPSTAVPAKADDGPDSAVEVGVKFRSDVNGSITALRFFKAATNTGTHVASLWTSSGTLLARATFSGETASGWQQVTLSTSVSITANTVYIASYHTNVGHYSDDLSYFAGKGADSPPLHALADGVSGVNGVYAYSSSSKFPNLGYKQSNYWVDVVFSTTAPLPSDTLAPTVTAFAIPSTSSSLTVPITTFTATDNVSVTGYLVTESSSSPTPTASGWTTTVPGSYNFTSAGSKTLYAWAKDGAGNVSASKSANVTITLGSTSTGPEPTGWFTGDIHVHRSCGGSPESVSSIYSKMATNSLSVASLLADMGNGEVQNPTTDLPLVNGQDASVSTPGRIVHWDTEWHWDATYSQYAHQALGGHIVALGLASANQIWQEYTYPIFNWAHQQGGIAGFAHMQYLDDGIPQSLTCCTPIEYPVEVALGSADFISEDVDDTGNQGTGMHPEAALHAYYRLLNNGFRPGLAAGTDYPCNSSRPLGSLLTYAQPTGGQMNYRNWISAIKAGRTVVSRNGHKEFLNLVVNGTATPGDEIKLASEGSVQVSVQWTATQNLTGTIELLRNGEVVASKQGSVTSGAPLTLTTTVPFSASGWLAARRMNSGNEHQVHTSAVFVTVNGAPVRASASDAQFYVDWMNTLLTNTSRGGIWNSYFPTSLAAAQARYQAAKTIYQQILADATAGNPTVPSIFTSQVPTMYENEASYEFGTKFYTDVSGQLTGVRIYTNAVEGGAHTVRIWQVSNKALLAGPYTWNISSGTEGWKTFNLPAPLGISANTDYIVDVSNSSDHYYAEEPNGFNAAVVNGHLHTYVGSGVFSGTLGTMPTSVWQNTNYFRDVVFAPQN
jgi:Domain of unknown function (DUF4082)